MKWQRKAMLKKWHFINEWEGVREQAEKNDPIQRLWGKKGSDIYKEQVRGHCNEFVNLTGTNSPLGNLATRKYY